MHDDNHIERQWVDVAADYAAARKLGADPPEIPAAYLAHGNGLDVMMPREEYITIDGDGLAGFDGHMQIPLGCVDQVIEVLRSVPRP